MQIRTLHWSAVKWSLSSLDFADFALIYWSNRVAPSGAA